MRGLVFCDVAHLEREAFDVLERNFRRRLIKELNGVVEELMSTQMTFA